MTWDAVPQFDVGGSNTFQITLFLGSGQYRISYNGMTSTGADVFGTGAIVGASSGGASAPFVESDLSAKQLTKGTQPGFLAELFTGAGGAENFDLDGRCLKGNPTSAGSTPQVHLR